MNKKIIGILICILLIITFLPIVNSTNENQVDDSYLIDECGCETSQDTNINLIFELDKKYPVMTEPVIDLDPDTILTKPTPVSTPDEFSWKDYNGEDWTTPAKCQAYCGSCWDFAALSVFESIIKIREECSEFNPDLSEQYVLSCLPRSGSCHGGSTSRAFKYIIETSPDGNNCNGVVYESCFPYQKNDDIPCSEKCPDWEETLVPLLSYGGLDVDGSPEDREVIKTQIIQSGPVAAGMKATDFFQTWGSIFHDPEDYYPYLRKVYGINHVVMILGWKDKPTIRTGGYWICKNSWGRGWGYDGYFNIAYGSLNIDSSIIWADYDPDSFDWPPMVDTGGPYGAYQGELVTFDGSKSYSVESEIISYHWDFGDGTNDTGSITTNTYQQVGVYNVTLTVTDSEQNTASETTRIWVQTTNNAPEISNIDGPTNAKAGKYYYYNFTATDPEGNDLYYYIDWGDGEKEEWIGPYHSDEQITLEYGWAKQGTYTIKAKAKDVFDDEGEWSYMEITMPKNTQTLAPMLIFRILERLMNLLTWTFPILRNIMGL